MGTPPSSSHRRLRTHVLELGCFTKRVEFMRCCQRLQGFSLWRAIFGLSKPERFWKDSAHSLNSSAQIVQVFSAVVLERVVSLFLSHPRGEKQRIVFLDLLGNLKKKHGMVVL